MDEYSSILGELIKAKESIKQKYQKLKSGDADVQSLVTHTLKPIIKPLNDIQTSLNVTGNPVNRVLMEEQLVENLSDTPWEFNADELLKSPNKDGTYGPKKLSSGEIRLGNKKVEFIKNTLIIDGKSYPLTNGLVHLIFSRKLKSHTEHDLSTYKQILIQTSAHLLANGEKIKKGGHKYTNVIQHLFSSGEGMMNSVNLQKYNIVYYDDPNELVNRLRLLLASRAAGNTGVTNEILSIFEELYEAGLITNIPNV